MIRNDQNPFNKHIMVGLMGMPNVGKSSLINTLLGFDLSIVSSKEQTTRNQFHCILTIDHTEIVMVDTPGIHRSGKEFNKRINGQVKEGLDGCDLHLLLLDLTQPISKQLTTIEENFNWDKCSKIWIVFTKSDSIPVIPEEQIESFYQKSKELIPQVQKYFVISAKTENNIHLLTGALADEAESGPHFYANQAVSNKNERFFSTEYIREQVFHLLQDELPYEIAITIDEFKDLMDRKPEPLSIISANILVNRPSQRAIVIGSKGAQIKRIGTRARKKIEQMLGRKVQLNLHVKVSQGWQKNNYILEEIGLPRVADSKRVWKKPQQGAQL